MPVNFVNDLGIIPNKGTENENNKNLLQGQKYRDYARTYLEIAKPHLAILDQSYNPSADNTKMNNTKMNNAKMNNAKKIKSSFKKKRDAFKGNMNSNLIKKKQMTDSSLNKKKTNKLSSLQINSDYYLYIFFMALFCILLFLILKRVVTISCNHILLVIVLIIVFIIPFSSSNYFRKIKNLIV